MNNKTKNISVKRRTEKNIVKVKQEEKEKINKIINKTKDLFEIAEIINCNYCIMQTQLLQILNIYNYKYKVERDIYAQRNELDGMELIYNKGDEIDYTENILNKLIRNLRGEFTIKRDKEGNVIKEKGKIVKELKDYGLIEVWKPTLPNGTFSNFNMIRFKRKAVALYKEININELNTRNYRKPNSNTKEWECMLKAQIIIDSKDYFKNFGLNNKDGNLLCGVKKTINTFMNNKYEGFYKYFIKNNINVNGNTINLKEIKLDLNRLKENKEIETTGRKERKKRSKNLFTLKNKFMYLSKMYNEKGLLNFDFIILNPNPPDDIINYIYKIDEVCRVIESIFPQEEKINEKYHDYSKDQKYKVNIYIYANSEYEKEIINKYLTEKKGRTEYIYQQNFVFNHYTEIKEIQVINLNYIFGKKVKELKQEKTDKIKMTKKDTQQTTAKGYVIKTDDENELDDLI